MKRLEDINHQKEESKSELKSTINQNVINNKLLTAELATKNQIIETQMEDLIQASEKIENLEIWGEKDKSCEKWIYGDVIAPPVTNVTFR